MRQLYFQSTCILFPSLGFCPIEFFLARFNEACSLTLWSFKGECYKYWILNDHNDSLVTMSFIV